MTFKEWFNSAPHRKKYSSDHPAYLAAQEAWDAAHEACAEVCDVEADFCGSEGRKDSVGSLCAAAIRARKENT